MAKNIPKQSLSVFQILAVLKLIKVLQAQTQGK